MQMSFLVTSCGSVAPASFGSALATSSGYVAAPSCGYVAATSCRYVAATSCGYVVFAKDTVEPIPWHAHLIVRQPLRIGWLVISHWDELLGTK
ncbi:hypothetical protein DPMN_040976 [Dreissena polymorpha]|uniref:Uncharacterized protein n=1 Tax=Dreissena polymorpha TaxID=45954 RepID=A0A9D4CWC9_DREPO|nr:hypothetical protein DPMN_040976 [Dreissena polymorpha]